MWTTAAMAYVDWLCLGRPDVDVRAKAKSRTGTRWSKVFASSDRPSCLSWLSCPSRPSCPSCLFCRDLRLELSRPRSEGRQPLDLQVGARAKQIDQCRREDGEVDLVAAPVGTAAVVVGQAVVASKIPRAEEHAGSVPHVRVGRQCGDRPSGEQRRLRLETVRIMFTGVARVF